MRSTDYSTRTYHFLAEEVLLERALPSNIILKRNIPVSTECTRKYGNVSKNGFTNAKNEIDLGDEAESNSQGLIQDI